MAPGQLVTGPGDLTLERNSGAAVAGRCAPKTRAAKDPSRLSLAVWPPMAAERVGIHPSYLKRAIHSHPPTCVAFIRRRGPTDLGAEVMSSAGHSWVASV